MSTSTSSAGGGIGLGGLLVAIFVTLKLVGVIDWSWWWVTAPIWIPLSLLLGIVVVAGVAWAILRALEGKW